MPCPRVVLLLCLVLPLGATVVVQPPAVAPTPPTAVVEVSATGRVRLAPDIAVLRLGASADADEAALAQQRVDAAVQAALRAFRERGIPQERIQTQVLQLHPVYRHGERQDGEPGAPRVVGYRASTIVAVEVDDLSLLGGLVDAGVAAGLNEIEGIRFEVRDQEAARRQALQQAMRRAGAEAAALATAAGLRLGPVLRIATTGDDQLHPVAMREFAAGAATTLPPGQVEVTAQVSVRFALQDGD